MKITILHYAAPPVVGGVESVLGMHADLMCAHGHQVQILAGRGEQMDEAIPFILLPLADSRHLDVLHIKEALDTGNVPPAFQTLVDKLYKSLSEISADQDVLIAHNVCSLSKNLALTAALRQLSLQKKKPHIILWHHDLAWTTPRYLPELHDGYPWDLLRTDWPEVTQVVVSKLRRDELCELMNIPTERVVVVPNGIEIERFFKLEAQTTAFVRRLGLYSAAPLLLLPVRITPRKNIELAIHVLEQLLKHMPTAKLVITGPLGPHNPKNIEYFEELTEIRSELHLEHNVHFLAELSESYLPDEVIADFYNLADALLMPSREEGFGIPILEAGLSGIPVFCSDIPPLRELGETQAQYFPPDGEPNEIATMIAKHIANDPLYQFRVRVRTEYPWEGIYQKHIAPLLKP